MITKWVPTTDLKELRRLGKLQEELNELGAVVARCIIQGFDKTDPSSNKVNGQRLEEEIADVYAQLHLVEKHYGLDVLKINGRIEEKLGQMSQWETLCEERP